MKRPLRFGPDTTGAALAEWRESLAFLYERLEPIEPEEPFYIEGEITQLPRACLIDSGGSALTMVRGETFAERAPVDQVVLFRLASGRVEADYQGRHAVLEPGDLVTLDYQRAQSSRATAFRCATVALPRAVAPARFRSGDLHGVRVAATSPAGQLLGRHFKALFDLSAELSFDEAEAAVTALFALAAAIWPEPEVQDVGRSDMVLDQAAAFIDAHLGDSNLGPDYLCKALGISRTALYRVFASVGGVSATILKRRLEASVLALVRSEPRPGLVKRIAGECGFRSSPQFSKAFRERYGRTPGEVAALRASDVGGGLYTDWFDTRAREAGYDTVALWLKAKTVM